MTDSNLEAPHSARPASPLRLDLWLNIAIAVLVVALIGGVAFFGYSYYRDTLTEDQSSATGRIAAALGAQVRKSPNDPILRVRYGEALGAMGKYQQAIDQLNAAVKIDPKRTGAFLDLGMVAQLTNNYSAAEGYYKKVIDLTEASQYTNVDPTREQAYYNLGVIYMQQKRWTDAAGSFKASLRIRSDASDTYYNLAKCYQALGDPDAAMHQLQIAVQFDPSFAEAHYLLGQLYQQKKDDVHATQEYALAAQDAPTADPPKQALESYGPATDWIDKARTALGTGDLDTALNDVIVARNLDAKSFDAAKLNGQILVERGDLKDALDVYRQAAKMNPKDAEVQRQITTLAAQVKTQTPQQAALVKKAAKKKAAKKKKAAAAAKKTAAPATGN